MERLAWIDLLGLSESICDSLYEEKYTLLVDFVIVSGIALADPRTCLCLYLE